MGKKIEKAYELSDAKISFVSFVDKAANKRQFLITKAEDGNTANFATQGKILKIDNETHYVTGVVYEPLKEDTHGNFMTEEEIRKAAHWFAKNGDSVDLQHSFKEADGIAVVESYVAPCDMEIGGEVVTKGTWLITTEVENTDVWDKVEKGEYTGYSMGGRGNYSEEDVELVEKSEKGLIARITKAVTDIVTKGEVKDRFKKRTQADGFWAAWYALCDTLYSYDWESDEIWLESDETKIREALSEFTEIVSDLLIEDEIMKSMSAERLILKAGKKISGENYSKLEKIYNDLGSTLETLSEDKKEDEDVKKEEVQAMIEEAVTKAMNPDDGAGNGGKNQDKPLTADVVQKMISDAVAKATAKPDDGDDGNEPPDTLTEESVQKMIAKAVEPILKARGLPSNLDDDSNVQKSDDGEHYLKGFL